MQGARVARSGGLGCCRGFRVTRTRERAREDVRFLIIKASALASPAKGDPRARPYAFVAFGGAVANLKSAIRGR
jgi:hypothetical protein